MISTYLSNFNEGKCEMLMRSFPDDCIDLVITSPPYADQRSYGASDSKIPPDKYIEWFIPKAVEIYRILKDTGSFILNINNKVVKGEQHLYVYELVIALVKDVGFHLVRDYIWHNPSAPPNIYSTGKYGRTKKNHEYFFWFSKSNKWYFNMMPIRKPYGNDMIKYLQGNGKGDRLHNKRPSTHSFNCGVKWADNGGSDPGSVITIGNTVSNDTFSKICKERGFHHPARFPEKLVEFFILSSTKEDDIVLDPFCGSGTTAVSAHRNNRRWIGIDANPDYCDLSKLRMNLEFPEDYPLNIQ